MSARRGLALLFSCLGLACSSSDAASGSDVRPDAGSSGEGGAPSGGAGGVDGGAGGSDAALEVAGTFLLELHASVPATAERPAKAAYSELLGQALTGETPSGTLWTMTAEEGGCRLLEPSVPLCDPSCSDGEVCVEDGVCAGYPDGIDVGAVTLSGIRTEDGGDRVEMNPLPPSNTYQLPGSPRLAYPPFEPGDEVTLDAEGGALSAFSIQAAGLSPLVLPSEDDVTLDPTLPTALRWEPGADADAVIRVVVDISHHGGKKGEIQCETGDDGDFEIPAVIGAALIELGVAGNPTLELARESSGSASVEGSPGTVASGSVELRIRSAITLGLQIPGVVSCDEPGMQGNCPDGQLCQPRHVCE